MQKPRSQFDGGNSLIEVLSHQKSLVCVKLTKKLTSIRPICLISYSFLPEKSFFYNKDSSTSSYITRAEVVAVFLGFLLLCRFEH